MIPSPGVIKTPCNEKPTKNVRVSDHMKVSKMQIKHLCMTTTGLAD